MRPTEHRAGSRNFACRRRVRWGMRRALIPTIAGACALALAGAPSALARAGALPAEQTYPAASALCASARAGTLPPRLTASRVAVIAACDTLENAFGPLASAVQSADSTLLASVAHERELVDAACPRPVVDRAACEAARSTRRTTDAQALATRRAAVEQYHASIEANRRAFWSAIAGLRTNA